MGGDNMRLTRLDFHSLCQLFRLNTQLRYTLNGTFPICILNHQGDYIFRILRWQYFQYMGLWLPFSFLINTENLSAVLWEQSYLCDGHSLLTLRVSIVKGHNMLIQKTWRFLDCYFIEFFANPSCLTISTSDNWLEIKIQAQNSENSDEVWYGV